MRAGTLIVCVGVFMIGSGLVMFYSINSNHDLAPMLRMLKHAGTFVGLMGIGVTVAGILLYLVNRQPDVQIDHELSEE